MRDFTYEELFLITASMSVAIDRAETMGMPPAHKRKLQDLQDEITAVMAAQDEETRNKVSGTLIFESMIHEMKNGKGA